MLFQRPGGDRSFIPEDYSRLHTEMAESMMGEEEACLSNKQKKKIQVKECDISNGDGTVDDHNKRDFNDLIKETKALKAEGAPRMGVGNEAMWGR